MPAHPSLLAALVILVPAVAAAEPPQIAFGGTSEDADPFGRSRIDLAAGLLVGAFSTGPVDGPAVGMHLDAGWNRGPLFAYGEYDLLSIGEPDAYGLDDKPLRGMLQRVSANLRYSFFELHGHEVPLGGEFWLEGGLGRQLIQWNEGGKLHRTDGSLGFGAQFDVMARRDSPRPQVFSVYYALKMTIARAPGAGRGQPTCAGPCDEATPPAPWDLGVFFNFGLSWGR